MTENEISYQIRKAIFNVYNGLGPGLLESIYQKVLIYELEDLGLQVKYEVPFPIVYNDIVFDCNFRIDILVEDSVIIELKSVKNLEDIHYKQLSTYLKLADKRLGILVNFNTVNILDSIKRVVYKFED
ncbi:GxxExxY protein [Chryseobacterium manosquense]|uniref:GxxExxY protein n=1 Tax=Chryseobacterium manosquense TaxID=2754694 RepID=A0A7H1DUC4_9FLAO|nr:GxxExxY protein [Chryseobacterium manosquense]QNS40582.1 GxxExxY protein [Chryseobacterium manosquense]ROI06050.1 GxxExxY protein [Kaistella haifensis]